MAVSVTSINPAGASSNVAINKVIAVTFTITGGATGLDTTTLTSNNFPLRHTKSNVIIRTAVSWDNAVSQGGGTYTQVVYVTPSSLLARNSSFTLKVIGYDATSSFLSNIQDSSDNNLSGITIVVFTTGDDIATTGTEKTDSEQAREGDIRLPAGLKLTTSARFQLVSSTPYDRSWGFTGNTVTIEFNRDVQTGAITNEIEIVQHPFLDEQGWFAGAPTGGLYSGSTYFQWHANLLTDWDDYLTFTVPTWTATASGKFLNLTTTSQLLKNTRYEIFIYKELEDTSGNELEGDYYFTFTGESYPSYITPRTIRVEIPSVFDNTNSDFIHELIWKNSIAAFRMTGRNLSQFGSDGPFLRNFVKYSVILDIMYDKLLNQSLVAGQRKTLGDFEIEYNPNAGNINKDSVVARLEKKLEEAKRTIVASNLPQIFIRGMNSNLDTPNFRQRLWANPRQNYNNFPFQRPDLRPIANTQEQRDAKLPGADDSWT